MTLEEIFGTISFKYPHSYTNEDIVKIINRVQKELFRTLFKLQTVIQYDLIADNAFYPVAANRIIGVVVDGCEYLLQNIRDSNSYRNFYYTTETNMLGIYPTPTEDVVNGLTVFCYKEPGILAAGDSDKEPEFDSAWHMILVYRVCVELAEASRDTDMVNGFIAQVNGLEKDYYRGVVYEPTQVDERW